MGGLGGSVAALAGAASVAGVMSLVKDMAEMADVSAKAADALGMDVERLQEWEFAAARGGVAANEFRDAAKETNIRLVKALSGESREQDMFAAMGLSVAELQKMKPEQVLDHIADSFAEIEAIDDPVKRAQALAARQQLAQDMFGGSGQKMIVALKGGSEALAAARADAQKFGAVVAEEDMRAAEKFNDTMADLEAVFKGTSSAIIGDLLPSLEGGARWLAEFSAENKALVRGLAIGTAGVAAVGGALGAMSLAYSMALGPIVKFGSVLLGPGVGGVKAFMLALRSGLPILSALRIAILTNPIGLIATAAVAAAGAAYLLWSEWDTVVTYLQAGFDMIKGTFAGPKVQRILDAFDQGIIQGLLSLAMEFNPVVLFQEAIGALTDYLFGVNLFEAGSNMVYGLMNGLEEEAAILARILDDPLGALEQALLDLDLSEAGANIVRSILAGIRDLADELGTAIADPLSALREYLPFSPAKRGPLMDIDKAGENIIGNVVGGMESAADRPAAALQSALAPMAGAGLAGMNFGPQRPQTREEFLGPILEAGGLDRHAPLPGPGIGGGGMAPGKQQIEITISFENAPPGIDAQITGGGNGPAEITLNVGRSKAGTR